MTFIKEQLGRDPEGSGRMYESTSGYLICGKRPENSTVKELAEIFKKERIYIYTFEDIIHKAETIMSDYKNKIKEYEEMDALRRSILKVSPFSGEQ